MIAIKKVVLIILIITIGLTVIGCGKDSIEQEEKVGIRGEITEVITDDAKGITAVLVEGQLEEDTSYDKARVAINEKTQVLKVNGGEKMSVEDLRKGLKVEVVFEGPAAESYPVQAKAKIIRVIE